MFVGLVKLITKLLSTAVKLYLRSQVSQAENLQVKISGKNRQIIQGYIPQVFLSCKKGVYRGLHLKEIEVNGNNIAVNLPEVLKNKPLKLLEPIIIKIKLGLDANDLLNSLNSDLLQSGLTDLWQIILKADRQSLTKSNSQLIAKVEWDNIKLYREKLAFSGVYRDKNDKVNKLIVLAGASLSSSHTLCLSPLQISNDLGTINELVDKLEIDLGDVAFEDLTVTSEQISCSGKITVNN